jgi:hypothetical protein
VRIWQSTSTGEQLVGLLLDGPEPLPRPNGGTLELRSAAEAPIPVDIVQGASGTRTLILFRDGAAGLKALAPAPLRLVVGDAWTAADGSSQSDSATLDLAVPARPAFLEPEEAP